MLQANSAAVESTGQAKAEAQSRAEALRIEGESAVERASLKAKALKIAAVSCMFRHWVVLGRNILGVDIFFRTSTQLNVIPYDELVQSWKSHLSMFCCYIQRGFVEIVEMLRLSEILLSLA